MSTSPPLAVQTIAWSAVFRDDAIPHDLAGIVHAKGFSIRAAPRFRDRLPARLTTPTEGVRLASSRDIRAPRPIRCRSRHWAGSVPDEQALSVATIARGASRPQRQQAEWHCAHVPPGPSPPRGDRRSLVLSLTFPLRQGPQSKLGRYVVRILVVHQRITRLEKWNKELEDLTSKAIEIFRVDVDRFVFNQEGDCHRSPIQPVFSFRKSSTSLSRPFVGFRLAARWCVRYCALTDGRRRIGTI